jgi:uncharacterized membrane protein YphA (DoxX/SURF4 family)
MQALLINTKKQGIIWNLRRISIEVIAVSYLVLFLHAAVSKLNDYSNFISQLSKSPFITQYAGVIAWSLPVVEILIAAALMFNKTRMLALYSSLFLMTMFTAYIWLMLNYSYDVPCSCGGVLENLGWVEHLWFNIGFTVLAIVGILLLNAEENKVAVGKSQNV